MNKIQALENLKENHSYVLIAQELKWIVKDLDSCILNEQIPIKDKEVLIVKRNLIQLFIDLPDDLIEQYKVEESNTATAPNLY